MYYILLTLFKVVLCMRFSTARFKDDVAVKSGTVFLTMSLISVGGAYVSMCYW